MKKGPGARPLQLHLAFFLLAFAMASRPDPARAWGGALPAGLPQSFALGVSNGNPGTLDWILQTRGQSGACWDLHYQYLTGGVNTGNGWETWNDPVGQFARSFVESAYSNALVPVFTYYEIVPSEPNAYDESSTLAKLQNSSTMRQYYDNLKLLYDKLREDGRPVLLHVEPDLWGMIHQSVFGGTNDPAAVPVAVGGSGNPLVSGLPDNAAGFARAFVELRDRYAPNVILAIHWSAWGNNDLFHCSDCDEATIREELAKNVEFYGGLIDGGGWSLFFADPDDRDADWHYLQSGGGNRRWISPTAKNIGGAPPSLERMRFILNELSEGLRLRSMLWQLPLGNSYYLACNNSNGHFRDNLVESFLPPVGAYAGPTDPNSSIARFAEAGVIGLLFGSGLEQAGVMTTHFTDLRGDGVTNPDPSGSVPGQPGFSSQGTALSSHADDDGGYLRLGSAAYCSAGRYPLPRAAVGGAQTPIPGLLIAAAAILARRRRRS